MEAADLCMCCLGAHGFTPLSSYSIQHPVVVAVCNISTLKLCCVCRRMAVKCEIFLKNLCAAQSLLQDCYRMSNIESVYDEKKSNRLKILSLKKSPVDIVSFSIEEEKIATELRENLTEIKHEGFYELDVEYLDEAEDYTGLPESDGFKTELKEFTSDHSLIESGVYPRSKRKRRAQVNLCAENENGGVGSLDKKRKSKKSKKADKCNTGIVKSTSKMKSFVDDQLEERYEVLKITKAELEVERTELRQMECYVKAPYHCYSCVLYFTFKESYDSHMEKHTDKYGLVECEVCGQRAPSEHQLRSHRRAHYTRYRCMRCASVSADRSEMRAHCSAPHCPQETPYQCSECPKSFLKRFMLMKHIRYKHSPRERPECEQCGKTYVSKESLKIHVALKHSGVPELNYVCALCDRGFPTKATLKAHGVSHSERRDFYCVECDRSFKSAIILKMHLLRAQPHANDNTMRYECKFCQQKFVGPREHERHVNRIHLNIKPYKCEKCDKAYPCRSSLLSHTKIIHDRVKSKARFPCSYCGKVFNRSLILASHIRTHTGERPFLCDHCPATFAHSGALHTHNRLVHLKLTRSGKPKGEAPARDTRLVGQ